MSEPAGLGQPTASDPPPTLLDRVAGGVLVMAATALIAVVESFYVPLRMGTVRVPVSIAVAVLCHPLLTWLMRVATRSGPAMIAPFAVWLAVVIPLSAARAEADLVITGKNWVATTLLYGGALLFVASVGVLLPARPRTKPAGPAGNLGGNGSS